ncbi:uncharacterized protein LOC111519843 isoform X2 [Drosophila willistoni]|nr:uncharacterized protein LOC111519843 isoform X2 [Drosophila willistoni]
MLISQNTEMLTQESEEDETTVSSSIMNGSWHQSSPHRTEPQPSNAAFLQRKIETRLDEIETRTSLAKLLSDFNQRLQNVIEINEKLKCRKSNASVNRNDNNSLGSSNKVTNSDFKSEQAGKDSKETVFLNLSPTQSFASDKKFESPPSKKESTLPISTRTNKSAKCDNFDMITQSSFDLSEQLTNSEISKADQLKLLLKIREKLLVDRAKSKIAWLELQKERLKSKGLKFQVSATKKKQRSILIKMEKDLKEMKRLFKSNEQSSETSSMQSQTENMSSNRSKIDENSKSSKIAALSLPLSLQFQDLKKQPERMHHRMLRLLKYIDNSLIYLTEDENSAHVEYVYTTGAKLNKLWKRLTMQNVEQFESIKWYKLCRNDFKQIYQEAKVILTLAFTANKVSNKCSSSQSGKMNLNVLHQLKPHLKRDIKDLSAFKFNAQNDKQLKIAIISTKDITWNANCSSITKSLHRIQGGEPFFSEMIEYVAAAISFNTLHAESMLNLKYLRVNAKQLRDYIPNTQILPTVLGSLNNSQDKQNVEPTINVVTEICLESHQTKLMLEPNYKSRLIGVDQPIYHNARSSEQDKYLQYSQTEKIVENGNAINSMYIREIPNKPPPPYVPPAPGSPMTTIFPSEERIRCLTYRRSHELFCKLSNTDYVNDKGDPLPSVMSEKITNIYERIVLEICQEWMDEHKDILNKRDPCNFRTSLSLFNPPNRLRSIQNSIYKDVRYALTMEMKSSNRSQSHLIYANRGKRDHIEKIIIQELFDEDQQWDTFHCNENEVLKLIIDSMIEQYVEQIVEESWNKANVQL